MERVMRMKETVIPRRASSLILARDRKKPGKGTQRLEILMIQRRRENVFASGVYAFPGGAVEEQDFRFPMEMLEKTRKSTGVNNLLDTLVSEGLSIDEALAVIIAGLRETFEETGLLPDCVRGVGSRHEDGPTLAEARRSLLLGLASFSEVLKNLGAKVDTSLVRYLAHWITPEGLPIRYDTRFFLAPCSTFFNSEHEVQCEEREITSYMWINPLEALERCRQGELPMLPPTVAVLSCIAGCPDVHTAMHITTGWRVKPVCPKLVERNGTLVLELPKDEE